MSNDKRRQNRLALRICVADSPMHWSEITQQSEPFYRSLEESGIPIDEETLNQMLLQKQQDLTRIKTKINQAAGFDLNPNRATDWQKLVESKGYTLPQTNTGKPKTDDWAVKGLRDDLPILEDISEARKLIRFISLLNSVAKKAKVRKEGGDEFKVNPTYSMDDSLGRVHSGGEANPMSWSRETQKVVRQPGKLMVKADYRAMELRVLQRLSGDSQLASDLASGDIHTEVAKTIFKTDSPTPEQRKVAKIVTFSTVNAGGPGTVAGPVNDQRRKEAQAKGRKNYRKMSWDQAEDLQEAWREKYSGAAEHLDLLGEAESHAVSYHGREKELPNPAHSDPDKQDKAMSARRRLAINNPIQNTAGDLARLGFVAVYTDERLIQMGARWITTIHDAILFSVPDDADIAKVEQCVREDMEGVDESFNLEVDIVVGQSWGDLR